jgi:hypothetical protein
MLFFFKKVDRPSLGFQARKEVFNTQSKKRARETKLEQDGKKADVDNREKKIKSGETKTDEGAALTEPQKIELLKALDLEKELLKKGAVMALEVANEARIKESKKGSTATTKMSAVKFAWDSSFQDSRSKGPAEPPLKIGKFNQILATEDVSRTKKLILGYAGVPCQRTEVPQCFKFVAEVDSTDFYVIKQTVALVVGQNAIWGTPVAENPEEAHFEIRMEFRLVGESIVHDDFKEGEEPDSLERIDKQKKTVMPAICVRVPRLHQIRSLKKDAPCYRKPHPCLDGHI